MMKHVNSKNHIQNKAAEVLQLQFIRRKPFSMVHPPTIAGKKQHLLSQTIVGAIIGSILGFAFYKYAKNQLQGPIKPKEDDYAPL